MYISFRKIDPLAPLKPRDAMAKEIIDLPFKKGKIPIEIGICLTPESAPGHVITIRLTIPEMRKVIEAYDKQ